MRGSHCSLVICATPGLPTCRCCAVASSWRSSWGRCCGPPALPSTLRPSSSRSSRRATPRWAPAPHPSTRALPLRLLTGALRWAVASAAGWALPLLSPQAQPVSVIPFVISSTACVCSTQSPQPTDWGVHTRINNCHVARHAQPGALSSERTARAAQAAQAPSAAALPPLPDSGHTGAPPPPPTPPTHPPHPSHPTLTTPYPTQPHPTPPTHPLPPPHTPNPAGGALQPEVLPWEQAGAKGGGPSPSPGRPRGANHAAHQASAQPVPECPAQQARRGRQQRGSSRPVRGPREPFVLQGM